MWPRCQRIHFRAIISPRMRLHLRLHPHLRCVRIRVCAAPVPVCLCLPAHLLVYAAWLYNLCLLAPGAVCCLWAARLGSVIVVCSICVCCFSLSLLRTTLYYYSPLRHRFAPWLGHWSPELNGITSQVCVWQLHWVLLVFLCSGPPLAVPFGRVVAHSIAERHHSANCYEGCCINRRPRLTDTPCVLAKTVHMRCTASCSAQPTSRRALPCCVVLCCVVLCRAVPCCVRRWSLCCMAATRMRSMLLVAPTSGSATP
jgi:hypothetical protein